MGIFTRSGLDIGQIDYTNPSPKDCLVRSGFADPPFFNLGFGATPNSNGKPYIQSIDGNPNGGVSVSFNVHPKANVLQVTGITDQAGITDSGSSSTVKVVDFMIIANFTSTNFPQMAQTCVEPVGSFAAHATMRLYDDGWRLVGWSIDPVNLNARTTTVQAPSVPPAATLPPPQPQPSAEPGYVVDTK